METERKEAPLEKARRIQREMSKGQAIRQYCWVCMGWLGHLPEVGNLSPVTKLEASKRVGECADDWCPVYPFRRGREERVEGRKRLNRGQEIKRQCWVCWGWTGYRDPENLCNVTKVQATRLARECADSRCPLFRFRPGARKGQ